MHVSLLELVARIQTNVELLNLLEVKQRMLTRGRGWRKLNSRISIRVEMLQDVMEEIEA